MKAEMAHKDIIVLKIIFRTTLQVPKTAFIKNGFVLV